MPDVVFHCPSCGSPAVDVGQLVGSQAKCRICNWQGSNEDLYGTPFEHLMGDADSIGLTFFNAVRDVLSDKVFVQAMARLLGRWGFINLSVEKRKLANLLARYMAASTRGVIKSLIEERENIEKEAHKAAEIKVEVEDVRRGT